MYEEDTQVVTEALKNANPVIFSDDTINKILNLTTKTGDTKVTFNEATPDANGNVTVDAGAEVVLIASSDTDVTTITPPSNAPVVIFQGKGGVVATLNDATASVPASDAVVDRVVVGSAGNDRIVVSDARDTQIILGTGNSSVTTGMGVDTVEAGLGNATVTGGSGDYAIVKLGGSATNYTVTTDNGRAIVTNNTTNKTTDISKIQYVQLDSGKALVFAKDSIEAAISTLYETAFGRTADAGGLDYWFDVGRAGATLKQIATAFTSSAEFAAVDTLSNQAFVQGLYQNTFGRAGEDSGVAFWVDALTHGATKADLIVSFSQIGANNIAGTIQTEAQVIGNVTIVTGII